MTVKFSPQLYTFLHDLEANNERDWFKANQDKYVQYIKNPALDFIEAFGPRLSKISPYFVADTRGVGGSLFRIQRDTRFAKDKTPYKTNTGMQFRHVMGKDAHAPGFYLNLEPGANYMGCGLWRPETKVAYQIREAIDADPTGWKKATTNKRFTDHFEIGGDSLTRPPKGYNADHPLIEDLKRKDFIASSRLTQKQVTSADILNDFTDLCKRTVPFMKFICDAVNVPF